MPIDDLKSILPERGFDYAPPGRPPGSDICPPCKRKTIAASLVNLCLAGHLGSARLAAAVSGVLFAGCVGPYLFVLRVDLDARGRC